MLLARHEILILALVFPLVVMKEKIYLQLHNSSQH